MAKSKGPRIMITLECTECRQNENKRCYCNKHTLHKETK